MAPAAAETDGGSHGTFHARCTMGAAASARDRRISADIQPCVCVFFCKMLAPRDKRRNHEIGARSRWVPGYGRHDMILGLAWMHTHLEGRGGHGTHGGFRERSERYQRHILGGC